MADKATKTGRVEAKSESGAGPKDKTTTDTKTESKGAIGYDAGSDKNAEKSTSDAPTGYSRGEKQKTVTDAYRNNWDAIFGKKHRRKSKT